MRQLPGVHHLLLLALLGGVAWWVGQRAQALRQDPAAVLGALRATQGPWLPAATAAGATAREELERYDPDTLYDFINGAADAYLARGFTHCLATTYIFAGEEGTPLEVSAEVYRFATPTGARGQLEAELPAGAQPLDQGVEAWGDGGVVLALAGTDYLKLTAYASGAAAELALRRLLAAWQKGGEE